MGDMPQSLLEIFLTPRPRKSLCSIIIYFFYMYNNLTPPACVQVDTPAPASRSFQLEIGWDNWKYTSVFYVYCVCTVSCPHRAYTAMQVSAQRDYSLTYGASTKKPRSCGHGGNLYKLCTI